MNTLTLEGLIEKYKEEQVFFASEDMEISVNSLDISGDSLLHIASGRGIYEEVCLLIELGANVNEIGEMSYTPLHYAVSNKHIEVVELLLKYGADATIKNSFGKAVIDTRNPEIITLLQKYNFQTKVSGDGGYVRREKN